MEQQCTKSKSEIYCITTLLIIIIYVCLRSASLLLLLSLFITPQIQKTQLNAMVLTRSGRKRGAACSHVLSVKSEPGLLKKKKPEQVTSTRAPSHSVPLERGASGSNLDVEVIGTVGEVNLAHSRLDCVKCSLFKKFNITDFCEECYCPRCEVKAEECPNLRAHCEHILFPNPILEEPQAKSVPSEPPACVVPSRACSSKGEKCIMNFGRNQFKTYGWVLKHNYSYACWVVRTYRQEGSNCYYFRKFAQWAIAQGVRG
jgi:hypothetical protein